MKLLLFCFLAGCVILPNTTSVVSAVSVTAVPLTDGAKRVEKFVVDLKGDLAKQENVLVAYVNKAKSERDLKQKQLEALTKVLSHLKEQLQNTTKYYNTYNSYVTDTTQHVRPLVVEYDRASALYKTTAGQLSQEREFLDAVLVYVRSNKRNCVAPPTVKKP